MKIKRAIQLNSTATTQDLTNLQELIAIESALLKEQRNELIEHVVARNLLLKDILLENSYLLSPTDIVIFKSQVNKIIVYNNEDPVSEFGAGDLE